MINNEAVKYTKRNAAWEALGKKLKPHLKPTGKKKRRRREKKKKKASQGKAPGPNNAMSELIKAAGNYVASTL